MNTIKNIIKVVGSNIVTIVAGIFVSFLLPKIISVSDYGFYKIFTLYFNYLGVLSLGIIDGIVLKYGGKEYSELEREKFRSYFSWYAALHIFITVIMLLVAVFLKDADYKFVLLLLAANLLPANVTGYLQQISQITQRFREYSLRKVLHSIANICLVFSLFLIYKFDVTAITYKWYIVGLYAIDLLLLIWYVVTYREILFGKKVALRSTVSEVLGLARLGFPLLLSNLCSTLLLNLDRQFVSILFPTEEYAKYAFAYSMLSLITVATSAISLVIYPVFKRMDQAWLKQNYGVIRTVFSVFLFFVILVYFPLGYFIEWFLPQYAFSMSIFRIILPGLAISASITVVMQNYYKVFGRTNIFFRNSIFALIFSAILNAAAYICFGTMVSISVASIVVLAGWHFGTEIQMRKMCAVEMKGSLYILIMSASFYACAYVGTYWLGGVLYLAVFLLISAVFFYKDRDRIKTVFTSG